MLRPILRTVGVALLAGCNSLTSIDAPDVIQPPSLESAEGAQALRAGALRRFAEMFGGGFTEGIATTGGLITDELISGETTLRSDTDARRDVEFGITGVWTTVGTARRTILDAIPYLLRQPDQGPRAGELYALLGLTETLIAENFCSGATLSRTANGEPVYGGSLSTAQIFDSALVHLDSAVVLAADSARILNLARVARARTLLGLGRFDEAAAAAAAVPTSFGYAAEFGGSTQQNTTFNGTRLGYGVADNQGGNGLDYVSAADPRVPTVFWNTAEDGGTPMYGFMPYASLTAPIVVASGLEARLIEAEVALRNHESTWLGILNDLRAGYSPALTALTDPGSNEARVDLLFRERAFWLFLTGHRLGDLRRLITHYGRAANSIFPTGTYKDGLAYGSATYIALPTEERFNPNFTGCNTSAP